MTKQQVSELANNYAKEHRLAVAGIRNIVRLPPDFVLGKDKVRGGDVWQVSFNNPGEEEMICSGHFVLEIDDIAEKVTRFR